MDAHQPHEPTPSGPTPETSEDTTAREIVAIRREAQPVATSRLPLILTSVAGALAGIMMVIALVSVRADVPVETSSPTAGAPAPPSPRVESAPPPTWTGARRAAWARDGSKTISFELSATRDVPAYMSRARPTLVVRCLYRATEVFVVLDTSANFEEDSARRTVRVQWDDEPAGTQQWMVSESGRELFAPDGVAFVRRLARAQALQFGFTPFNAQPVTSEFPVQGFDQLAGLVAGTCGWRLGS